jgi:hypothetical protein
VAVAAARSLLSNDGPGPSDWLEQLEVALAAAPILNEAAETAARRCAERLLDAHATTGSWFSDRLSRDEHDLSAISGISALAHAFLRLYAPDRFESIRLVK